MGLVGRKPILPAPTDSLVGSVAEETVLSEEVATDLSQRTDKTSHTIPDDGSPITISTRRKASKGDKGSRSKSQSQTSLLIEYFEGGKGPDSTRKPSVRVKVTPSSKNKGKTDGHILLTEAHGARQPSHSRRISLGSKRAPRVAPDSEISAVSAPLDIEIQQKGSEISAVSSSPEAQYIAASSDISSMPPDSLLGVQQSTLAVPRGPVESSNVSSMPAEGSELGHSEIMESSTLQPPVLPRERNLSNERITQKVIEKLSNKPREPVKISQRSYDRSSGRNSGRDMVAASSSEAPRLTSKHLRDDGSVTTATEPSMISNSVVSGGGRSIDDRSMRSGASNVSITNPKLLQTVEDAIRRLILPELKELKKEQRHASHSHRSKLDKDYSDLSESSVSRDGTPRRVSSGSRSKKRVSRDSAEAPRSRRHRSHHKDPEYDSQSDVSSHRRESTSSLSVDDPRHGKRHGKDHRTRDMAAAGLVGAGLTAAALKHHESEESIHRRRRRKRSKSHSSRSASIAESEDTLQKPKAPAMPMQSEIGSELTRSSLLSSNVTGTATPTQYEVREVVRGSPLETPSPDSQARTRQLGDLQQSLGTHHGNFSEPNLSANKLAYEPRDDDKSVTASPETERYDSAVTEEALDEDELLERYERNLHTQHPIRRGLSPIQSVASYATTEPNRTSMYQPRSMESFVSSVRKEDGPVRQEKSMNSISSASPDLKKPRPHGFSLENRSEIMNQHGPGQNRDLQEDDFQYDYDDGEGKYRDSYASEARTLDSRHLSGFTDDTSSVQYDDKVITGQHVVRGSGANPEYVSTPPGVESAVASLVEPSVLDMQASHMSQNSGSVRLDETSLHSQSRDAGAFMVDEVTEEPISTYSQDRLDRARHADLSPPQSPARSFEESPLRREVDSQPSAAAKMGQVGRSPDSEITTNPSPIQGPIAPGNTEPWPYNPNIAQSGQPELSRDFGSGAENLIPEGLNVSQRQTVEPKHTTYVIGRQISTPPGAYKDEGYATGDNYPSPGPIPKAPLQSYSPGAVDMPEDPFVAKRDQFMSGLSQGMSPLYDSATGRGIDRINSKDIVALMDHLTVRDAQRSARDTEILLTLVQSATEMRNSFDEMKAYLAEQDKLLVQSTEKQYQMTQKAIGGPRPLPNGARSQRTPSQEDAPTKRRNAFRRVFQGLGSKNTAELQNIEAMLFQLLDEVEGLRAQQANLTPQTISASVPRSQPRSTSAASEENIRPPTDPGYEPEGQAGTSTTTGDRSGFFSNNSSRQGYHAAARRISENRVSTVMEGDEEYDDYDDAQMNGDGQLTPRAPSPLPKDRPVTFQTPPRPQHQVNKGIDDGTPGHLSMDTSTSKKHKSFASSFLPKMVSRWSKTTASSSGDGYRSSLQQKARPYSQVSHSGEDVNTYQYEHEVDDRLRSSTSLQDEMYGDQENRPPSPLIPSQVSENPKYQGFRNSINLQHPRPQQGPTGRYQDRLESVAKDYDQTSPTSQTSSQWENYPSINAVNPNVYNQPAQYVQQPPLSPITDAGYSETSSAMLERDGYLYKMNSTGSQNSDSRRGPPRPPKVVDNEPLMPQRPPKMPMSPSTYVDHVAAARAGSPAYDKSPSAALRSPHSGGRKPSGPRPLSGQGKRTRFTNSPLQHDSEDDGQY